MVHALDAILDTAGPGVESCKVDRAARSIVEEAGLGNFWLHRTGYSMGVSFSPTWGEGEVMDIKAGDPRKLETGMVFHTVPWVLMPGLGCIGNSETWTVTETGVAKYLRRLRENCVSACDAALSGTAVDVARWRQEFAVTERYAYFDHASVGPTPKRAVEAVKRSLEGQASRGSLDHPAPASAGGRARTEYAAFIGARPGSIAHVSNTSAAISLIARGSNGSRGTKSLCPRSIFPSAVLPWKILERQGVTVRTLPCTDGRVDVDCLIEMIGTRTRVICASWVQFSSGHRLDIVRLGTACRRKGAF
jgi:hypothetical protein